MMLTELQGLPILPSSSTFTSHLSRSPTDPPCPSWRLRPIPNYRLKHTLHPKLEHILEDSPSTVPTITFRRLPDLPGLPPTRRRTRHLQDLPEEIQQGILDMLMGNLSSTSSSAADGNHGIRNWSRAMRHPRGRHLSDLALVSRSWRRMIQERLYRHVKIKGTKAGIEECADWFITNIHLQTYVRHIEFWVPVWERRAGQNPHIELSGTITFEQHAQPHTVITMITRNSQEVENINQAYQLASSNVTMDEIFGCASCLFPEACILTIEGGHCKKPPMIQQFRNQMQGSEPQKLPQLPNIRTLVLKGAWNIIRNESHFATVASALPNLREWHCTYAKPKAKAYQTTCAVIQNFPTTLTHLNICLEGFYSKEITSPAKIREFQLQHHLCKDLGTIFPQLEALTFTGRVCGCLFTSAMEAAERLRVPRLKSLDLTVKNCCRDITVRNDGTGIHNWAFIKAFESLVVSGVRALSSYPELLFLRIRFVDLDSPCPLLNPYFQLQNDQCTGIWNEEMLGLLAQTRPRASFPELSEGFGAQGPDKEGRMLVGWPTRRPQSIKVTSYAAIAESGLGPW